MPVMGFTAHISQTERSAVLAVLFYTVRGHFNSLFTLPLGEKMIIYQPLRILASKRKRYGA